MLEKWTEPSQLACGDTLYFKKRVRRFLASDGWSLLYAMRGGQEAIEFASTSDGDDFILKVLPAVTGTWLSGDYQLEGFALNATSGERHQIYLNNFYVTPDLSKAPANLDTRTFCQKMLEKVERQLLKLAENSIQRSSVEQTEIDRVTRLDLTKQREKLFHERQGEIARENSRNGKPTGRKHLTVLSVMPPGFSSVRQFGAGNSVFNTEWP